MEENLTLTNLIPRSFCKTMESPNLGDPKLYVDVNIGKQNMERIVVYEGDTAESLAKAFCQKNQLNEEMEEKLVVMLDQQIAGVLPKIDENEEVSGE